MMNPNYPTTFNPTNGVLGAMGGLRNYKVEQRPDGNYLVVVITPEDFKREILKHIDPRLAPYVNVKASERGLVAEIKL
jgi:hypothetical protein